MFTRLILLSALILNAGCATYFLKKECEETNWFEYGEKVALSGKRLDEDGFVQKCRKAEAEIKESLLDRGFKKGLDAYCKPETTFLLGKKGQPFETSMCQGLNITAAKAKHTEGVVIFCQPESAYNHGTNGNTYNNICPENLEPAFLKQFNLGRKKYLQGLLVEKESSLVSMRDEERNLKRDLSAAEGELRGLTYVGVATNSNTNPHLTERKEQLERSLNDLRWKDRNLQNKKDSLQSEIAKIKSEIIRLSE